MVANTDPIFGKTMNNSWTGNIQTADTSYTAPSTNGLLGFTAGSNGAVCFRVMAKALGTNIQSVARVFINNGSTFATAANNCFLKEFTLPATTASNSSTTSTDIEFVMNIRLAAGYRLYIAIGTTVSAGWNFFFEGIDY
jgi:hypothetical protein